MDEFRIDAEAGYVWQACPRCGLDRIASANGIRRHDEFCNGPLQRYMTMLTEHGMVPFQREPWVNPRTGRAESFVLGERPRMQWRVSSDEWQRLAAWAQGHYGRAETDLPATLFGWPIAADPILPPRSIIFEPQSEYMYQPGSVTVTLR